jgi:hypothetical protein
VAASWYDARVTASIFLASFLGCLFAMGFTAIAVLGYIKWRTRRFIASNAEDIARRIKAEMSPDERRQMQAFASQFAPPMPPSSSEPPAPTSPPHSVPGPPRH